MIKVNLATLKAPVGATQAESSSGGAFLSSLFSKKGDSSRGTDVSASAPSSGIDRNTLRPLVILVVAYLAGDFLVSETQTEELAKRDSMIQKLSAQQDALQKQLGTMKSLEETRKKMDADEAVFKTKLATIERLIQGRQSTVQMLTTVSSTIPQEVWLNTLKLDEQAASIEGVALNMNQITDFMKSLNESAFFMEVDARAGKATDPKLGAEASVFQLSMKRRPTHGL